MIKDFFEVTICDLKGGGIHGKKGADNGYYPCCSGNDRY